MASLCEIIDGNWGSCAITVRGQRLRGTWRNGRPSFSGVYIGNGAWHFNFPDDRIYTVKVHENQQVLVWRDSPARNSPGGGGSGAGGTSIRSLGCAQNKIWFRNDFVSHSIAGEWASAFIYVVGTTLQGKWKNGQNDFMGYLMDDGETWECTVWNNQRQYFTFVRNCVVIDFGNGNVWHRPRDAETMMSGVGSQQPLRWNTNVNSQNTFMIEGEWISSADGGSVTVTATHHVWVGCWSDGRPRSSGIATATNGWRYNGGGPGDEWIDLIMTSINSLTFSNGTTWTRKNPILADVVTDEDDQVLLVSAVSSLQMDDPPPYTPGNHRRS